MRTVALLVFSLAWPYPEHALGQMSQMTRAISTRLLTANPDTGAPIVAADRAIQAIDRAKALLADRGRIVAAATIVDEWPITAPSHEAFAAEGTIFVNRQSDVLRAAMRSSVYDVVLASLLLHEPSHLTGATERLALQIELEWLMSEHADRDVIAATRRSIEREERSPRNKAPSARSPTPTASTK